MFFNFDHSTSNLINEINLDLETRDNYLIRSKNCHEFIKKNLINEDCFEKFKNVLLKI